MCPFDKLLMLEYFKPWSKRLIRCFSLLNQRSLASLNVSYLTKKKKKGCKGNVINEWIKRGTLLRLIEYYKECDRWVLGWNYDAYCFCTWIFLVSRLLKFLYKLHYQLKWSTVFQVGKELMQVGIGNFRSKALRNFLRAHFFYCHNVKQIFVVEIVNSCLVLRGYFILFFSFF